MRMRRGFTLMEINIAIGAMTFGLLSVISLFSLAFRENRQSVEDVQSAAYADAVLSRIVLAASATNLTWEGFNRITAYPDGADQAGWGVYIGSSDYESLAKGAFKSTMDMLNRAADGGLKVNTQYPADSGKGLRAGLLVYRRADAPAVLRIAFRASKNDTMFFSSPLYYTEVRFQGIPDKQ